MYIPNYIYICIHIHIMILLNKSTIFPHPTALPLLPAFPTASRPSRCRRVGGAGCQTAGPVLFRRARTGRTVLLPEDVEPRVSYMVSYIYLSYNMCVYIYIYIYIHTYIYTYIYMYVYIYVYIYIYVLSSYIPKQIQTHDSKISV